MIREKPYIGEILVELGYVSNEVIEAILVEHEPRCLEMCDYLVSRGFISKTDHQKILDCIKNSNGNTITAIISAGVVTREVFYSFIRNYFYSHKRIGEILIEKNIISKEQLETALSIQKKYKEKYKEPYASF